MKLPPVRFTVRSMMAAVAVVALVLWTGRLLWLSATYLARAQVSSRGFRRHEHQHGAARAAAGRHSSISPPHLGQGDGEQVPARRLASLALGQVRLSAATKINPFGGKHPYRQPVDAIDDRRVATIYIASLHPCATGALTSVFDRDRPIFRVRRVAHSRWLRIAPDLADAAPRRAYITESLQTRAAPYAFTSAPCVFDDGQPALASKCPITRSPSRKAAQETSIWRHLQPCFASSA